jgi:endo-1,4-beta-xylanase
MGRYKGRIFAWDVVNEGIGDNNQLRNTQWRRMIGDDYIDLAFQFARETDPDALLFYNDYGAEDMAAKSDAVYDLVSGMVERGIPIDGVGLQMHFRIDQLRGRDTRMGQAIIENIERLGALGLEIHITELDMRHDGPPEDWLLARQADGYRAAFEICLAAEPCTAVLTWGFTDAHSWIPSFFGNPEAAPLIFDADYQPKPAYTAIAETLANFETEAP